jgi:hypothetical protein
MKKLELIKGFRSGRLVVIEKSDVRIITSTESRCGWLCLCDCGNKKVVLASKLLNGKIQSCGCLKNEVANLNNKVFGRLTVKNQIRRSGKQRIYWLCECKCGKETIVIGTSLTKGLTKSCSCLRKDTITLRNISDNPAIVKHGMSGTPEWSAYKDAKHRCTYETNPRWKDYGGRGIKFLFTNFEQFLSELGPKPSPKHSLDRIKNDGHYESGNVQWATAHEQRLNQRKH